MSQQLSEQQLALHGKPRDHSLVTDGYEPLPEYADQGDTRVIRDLLFGYTAVAQDPAGNQIIVAQDALRGEEVTFEQIGLLNLARGEKYHSFYTTEELDRLRNTGAPTEPVSAEANLDELGEYELAEWLQTENPDTGRAWTINEILDRVGDNTDLAHRMLAAENIRSDGDPRAGLEKGLSAIIQGE